MTYLKILQSVSFCPETLWKCLMAEKAILMKEYDLLDCAIATRNRITRFPILHETHQVPKNDSTMTTIFPRLICVVCVVSCLCCMLGISEAFLGCCLLYLLVCCPGPGFIIYWQLLFIKVKLEYNCSND